MRRAIETVAATSRALRKSGLVIIPEDGISSALFRVHADGEAPDYYSQSPTRRDASSPSSCMAGHGATQSTGRPLLKLAANHHLHRTIFSKHEYSSTKRIVWQTQFKLAIVKVSFKMNENEEFRRLGSYPRFLPLEPSF